MRVRLRHLLLAWLLVTAAGCVVGSHLTLERLRTAFEFEAQSTYGALTQQMRAYETLVDTLALLQPGATPQAQGVTEQRIGSLYPAIDKLIRHDEHASWPAEWRDLLSAAEDRSRQTARAALVQFDLSAGSYWLVRGAQPASFALRIDLPQMASQVVEKTLSGRAGTWVWIEHAGERRFVVPGMSAVDDGKGWRFGFRRRLAVDGLPVDFVAQRRLDWLALPWTGLAVWFLATTVAALGTAAWLRVRPARRSPVEPSAGRLALKAEARPERRMASAGYGGGGHPLTAVVAPSPPQRPPLQVTLREVDAEPPELIVARGAIRHASRQSRRTSEAIAQLRRIAEGPHTEAHLQQVDWHEALRDALELIEPECERLGVVTALVTDDTARRVQADPVALEQIVYHLLSNSLSALAAVPAGERSIELAVAAKGDGFAELTLRDTGPGLSPQDAAQLFDAGPPATPRAMLLGRCAALAGGMGGSLAVGNATPYGAVYRLTLPLAA